MSRGSESLRLRAALHAYPGTFRASEGEVLLSLAREMIDEGRSTVNREASGLVRSGFVMRAGAFARAPWNEALHAVALPLAVVLLSLALGAMSFWTHGFSWIGWSWLAVAAGPALAILGLLTGLRLPVMLGGLSICLMGIAQGNGQLASVNLSGLVYWSSGGFDFPLLGCAIPAGVLITISGFRRGRRVTALKATGTLAWITVGSIVVRLLYPVGVEIAGVAFNGLAAYFGACLLAGVAGLVLAVARRSDPVTTLCGLLYMAVVMPILILYGISRLELGDPALLALTVAAMFVGATLLVRLTGLSVDTRDA